MHQGNYQQGRRSEDLLQIHLHIAAHRLNLNSVVKFHRKFFNYNKSKEDYQDSHSWSNFLLIACLLVFPTWKHVAASERSLSAM